MLLLLCVLVVSVVDYYFIVSIGLDVKFQEAKLLLRGFIYLAIPIYCYVRAMRNTKTIVKKNMVLIFGGLLVFLIFTSFYNNALTELEFKRLADSSEFLGDPIHPDTVDNTALVINGAIGLVTAETFFERIGTGSVKSVQIDRNFGGQIGYAIEIGNKIKELGLPVFVHGECSSSCVIIATSGQPLYAGTGAIFGLHQGAAIEGISSRSSYFGALSATETLINQLRTNGVSQKILRLVEETPNTEVHYLSRFEFAKEFPVEEF